MRLLDQIVDAPRVEEFARVLPNLATDVAAAQSVQAGALIEHIEVGLPLRMADREYRANDAESLRSSPRLHHVRGQLVRRADHVFWRSPHWRGALRLGQVRSRTVSVNL